MPMEFGLIEDPATDAERTALAGTCVDELDLPMPALVDGVDDKVGRAWSGWPDRLYLVGTDGKVAYAGARGPFGFLPDEWNAAIERELAKARGDAVPAKEPAQDPATGPAKTPPQPGDGKTGGK